MDSSREKITWKKIEVEKWSRWPAFQFFKTFDSPYFSLTTTLKTPHLKWLEDKDLNCSLTFVVTKALNEVEEFRVRPHGNDIGIWSTVAPSIVVLNQKSLPVFCRIPWSTNYGVFKTSYKSAVERAKLRDKMEEDDRGSDDVIYMSAVPWTNFTGIQHPIFKFKDDFIPRVAWSRLEKDGEVVKWSINIHCHHSLADAFHVSRFMGILQGIFDQGPR
jgi:chloramphenicol O-acetyltransferase type A